MREPRGLAGWLFATAYFMTFHREYRNVFYMRLGRMAVLVRWLARPLESLEIATRNIGPGFFIQHGVATLISAERIGANCWITQQVTIGFTNRADRPTIGDNVTIYAGAKVVGNITVGDNAVIGLNTVVISNVSANSTVFGVPSRVVWRNEPRPTHQKDRIKVA